MTDANGEKIRVYLGLIHFPVVNKRGNVVTTSVTNLDIHDIARTARTYGIQKYFIVTPLELQQQLVSKILGHWEGDEGNDYNPDRSDALRNVKVVAAYTDAMNEIEQLEGTKPLLAITGAKIEAGDGTHLQLREKLVQTGRPLLLLFGTGWGLAEEILQQADFSLKHLAGAAQDGYNHLSVRSAVAIYCDRLLGAP